jgi:hypothetical protein
MHRIQEEYVQFAEHKQRKLDRDYIEAFDPRTVIPLLAPQAVWPRWFYVCESRMRCRVHRVSLPCPDPSHCNHQPCVVGSPGGVDTTASPLISATAAPLLLTGADAGRYGWHQSMSPLAASGTVAVAVASGDGCSASEEKAAPVGEGSCPPVVEEKAAPVGQEPVSPVAE